MRSLMKKKTPEMISEVLGEAYEVGGPYPGQIDNDFHHHEMKHIRKGIFAFCPYNDKVSLPRELSSIPLLAPCKWPINELWLIFDNYWLALAAAKKEQERLQRENESSV